MCDQQIICRCLGIPRKTVEQAIDVFSAETIEEVARLTEAGTGCMCCRCEIKDLIQERKAMVKQLEVA